MIPTFVYRFAECLQSDYHQSGKLIKSPTRKKPYQDKHLHFGKLPPTRAGQQRPLVHVLIATLQKQQSSEPVNKSSCDYADNSNNAQRERMSLILDWTRSLGDGVAHTLAEPHTSLKFLVLATVIKGMS